MGAGTTSTTTTNTTTTAAATTAGRWSRVGGLRPHSLPYQSPLGPASLHYSLSPPLQVVEGGLRPALKKGWPPLLCALLEECWHVQPVRRPGMREVCGRLRELLSVK